MGETKKSSRINKKELDAKLGLVAPSRDILEELAVACAKNPSPDNTFQYAFCLSKSSEKSELRYAVTILDGLIKEGYEHQVDCMFGSATAMYLLGDFKEARKRCEAILRSNPENRAAAELHLASIAAQDMKDEDNMMKIAVGGSTAVAAIGLIAGVAGMVLSKR